MARIQPPRLYGQFQSIIKGAGHRRIGKIRKGTRHLLHSPELPQIGQCNQQGAGLFGAAQFAQDIRLTLRNLPKLTNGMQKIEHPLLRRQAEQIAQPLRIKAYQPPEIRRMVGNALKQARKMRRGDNKRRQIRRFFQQIRQFGARHFGCRQFYAAGKTIFKGREM